MCTFRDSWTDEYPWIERVERKDKVFCKLCSRALSIAHGGMNDIERHRKTNKHLRKEEKI